MYYLKSNLYEIRYSEIVRFEELYENKRVAILANGDIVFESDLMTKDAMLAMLKERCKDITGHINKSNVTKQKYESLLEQFTNYVRKESGKLLEPIKVTGRPTMPGVYLWNQTVVAVEQRNPKIVKDDGKFKAVDPNFVVFNVLGQNTCLGELSSDRFKDGWGMKLDVSYGN